MKLYQENYDKGLEVLGISNDSSIDDLRSFLASNKDMVWPELFGPSAPDGWNHLAHEMQVDAIPTEFFIDRNGILRAIAVNDLQPALVAKLLAEPLKPASAGTDTARPIAGISAADASAAGLAPPAAPTTDPEKDPNVGSASAETSSGNQEANSLLTRAKLLIASKRSDLAVDKLNTLIDQYPNSKAAVEAKQLLAQINGGQ